MLQRSAHRVAPTSLNLFQHIFLSHKKIKWLMHAIKIFGFPMIFWNRPSGDTLDPFLKLECSQNLVENIIIEYRSSSQRQVTLWDVFFKDMTFRTVLRWRTCCLCHIPLSTTFLAGMSWNVTRKVSWETCKKDPTQRQWRSCGKTL